MIKRMEIMIKRRNNVMLKGLFLKFLKPIKRALKTIQGIITAPRTPCANNE
jgi:hypothetical protein